MDAQKGLRLIESVENRMIRLYSTLASRFSDDESALIFFTDMKKDEQTHLKIARMETRMLIDLHQTHSNAVIDEAEVKRVLKIADKLIAENLTLEETLRYVYEIENSAAELYVITALQKADEKISSLLSTMGETFRNHRTAVHDFLEERGINADKLENSDKSFLTAPGKPKKDTALLINQDGQEELIVYEAALESSGYETLNFPNKQEAEKFLQEGGRLAIILIDIDSEENENFSFLPNIRKMPAYSRIPIVVMTTNYSDDFKQSIRGRGASAMLHKISTTPERLKQLLAPRK